MMELISGKELFISIIRLKFLPIASLFLLLMQIRPTVLQSAKRTIQQQRIASLTDPKVYSKIDPPSLDESTDIYLGVYLITLFSVSEQTMDYSVNMYLRQSWVDDRLTYKLAAAAAAADAASGENFKMEADWNRIWVPDTFFRNEKRSSFHQVTVSNRLVTIRPNGTVEYRMKISATLSCPMVLHKYPLDTQTCPMTFESFGYTTTTLNLKWLSNPFGRADDLTLTQFTLEDPELTDCTYNSSSGNSSPCLQIDFILHRDLGYYIIQVFLPSVLIVILSWVSFWINVDAVPARVSLGLLTVLTMTNHSVGINSNLPRVSYIKAIDVWMSSCLLFVFSALCEYAFVNVASRHKVIVRVNQVELRQEKKCCNKCYQSPSPTISRDRIEVGGGVMMKTQHHHPPPPLPKPSKVLDIDGKSRAKRIDQIARKSFPFAFVCFNVIYWTGYTLFVQETRKTQH